jgi:hypothetical protein
MTDIEQIKDTLSKMQAQIDILETKFNTINPQCFVYATRPIYTQDMLLSLSAARSLWPMLENEFDRYCTEHNVTVWTPTDSENFYRECIYD